MKVIVPLLCLALHSCAVFTAVNAAQKSRASITMQLNSTALTEFRLYVGEWHWTNKKTHALTIDMETIYHVYAEEIGVRDRDMQRFIKKHVDLTPFEKYTVGVRYDRPFESVTAKPLGSDQDQEKEGEEKEKLMRQMVENKDLQPYLSVFDMVQRAFMPYGLLAEVVHESTNMLNINAFSVTHHEEKHEKDMIFVFNIPNDTPKRYTPARMAKLFTPWRQVLTETPRALLFPISTQKTHTPVKSVVVHVTQIGAMWRCVNAIELYAVNIGKTLPDNSSERIMKIELDD
eukprot:GDKI01034303.1.p1 GENE.GDKI01034303.1~~GDKI01034303.1.p1  ORF type:complete len:288 (-),score=71.62 GDKI01034303.1:164-1027(-)